MCRFIQYIVLYASFCAPYNGNRKFIMVQLPELTYESKMEKYKDGDMEKERYIIDKTTKRPIIIKDSEARKAGYWTSCDIGKKRIRRA